MQDSWSPGAGLGTPAVDYCCSSMPRLSETHRFLQNSSFWEPRHALIGQLSSVLWLAEYLTRETEMLRPSPYCDVVSRRDEPKTTSPRHGAGGSNNTTARIIAPPSFIVLTFGRCFENPPTQWRRRGGVFEWAVSGGRGRVLTLIKNISLVLWL